MQTSSVSLSFRPTRLSDLTFVMDTEQRPENARFVNQWRQAQHEATIVSGDAAHYIALKSETQPVGYFILEGLQNPHRCVLLRRIVICEKGQGYGRQSLRWIKRHVFHQLNVHRLWLDVVCTNERAQALYVSEGFEIEGRLREAFRTESGSYEDMLILGLLAPGSG